jgi:hypothetical protein
MYSGLTAWYRNCTLVCSCLCNKRHVCRSAGVMHCATGRLGDGNWSSIEFVCRRKLTVAPRVPAGGEFNLRSADNTVSYGRIECEVRLMRVAMHHGHGDRWRLVKPTHMLFLCLSYNLRFGFPGRFSASSPMMPSSSWRCSTSRPSGVTWTCSSAIRLGPALFVVRLKHIHAMCLGSQFPLAS